MIPGTILSIPGQPIVERRANIGGPMTRNRSEHIAATLLGKDDGHVRCPCALRAGLAFEDGEDPLVVLARLLSEEGFASPEDLRDAFPSPERRMICRPAPHDAPRLRVITARADEVLSQALLLGLCSSQLFDPSRPVLWTQTSIARAVELFDPEGFYA